MTPADNIDGGQLYCPWSRLRNDRFPRQGQPVGGRVAGSNNSGLGVKGNRGYRDGSRHFSHMNHAAPPPAPRNAALRIAKVYSCRRIWYPRKPGTWPRQQASQGQGRSRQSTGRHGKPVTRLSAPPPATPHSRPLSSRSLQPALASAPHQTTDSPTRWLSTLVSAQAPAPRHSPTVAPAST